MSSLQRFFAYVLVGVFFPALVTANGIRHIRAQESGRGIGAMVLGVILGLLYSALIYLLMPGDIFTAILYGLVGSGLAKLDERGLVLRDHRRLRIFASEPEKWFLRHWRGLTFTAMLVGALYVTYGMILDALEWTFVQVSDFLIDGVPVLIGQIYVGLSYLYTVYGLTAIAIVVGLLTLCIWLYREVRRLRLEVRSVQWKLNHYRDLAILLASGYPALCVYINEKITKRSPIAQEIRQLIGYLHNRFIPGEFHGNLNLKNWLAIIDQYNKSRQKSKAS